MKRVERATRAYCSGYSGAEGMLMLAYGLQHGLPPEVAVEILETWIAERSVK